MNILAVKLRRLGDTILWTSALQALRERFPEAEIDIAFPSVYAPLFASDPRFRRKIPVSRNGRHPLAFIAQLRRLRKSDYDLALNFHASDRSAAFCFFSGAGEKLIHHHSRLKKNFFSDRRIHNLGTVMAANERDLNVIRTLGWNGKAPDTKIFANRETTRKASAVLKNLGWNEKEKLVVIQPHASRPAKEWGLEKYVGLAEKIAPRAKVAVVYDDPAAIDGESYLKKQLQRRAMLINTAHLDDVIGILSLANVYVGSDSGIKHLACALGVSTVTLFGPESIGEWHFYEPGRHRARQNRVACRNEDPQDPAFSWCAQYRCPLASHACMSLFTIEDVLTEVLPLL